MAFKRWQKSPSKKGIQKAWAESHFTWEPSSGSFVPHESMVNEAEPMPWE